MDSQVGFSNRKTMGHDMETQTAWRELMRFNIATSLSMSKDTVARCNFLGPSGLAGIVFPEPLVP
jgi:hypothetical protein